MDEGWELCILVEDLQMTRRIRVRGDTHIGGVMLKLIEAIEVRMDWSDHALWWPEENRWLLKTRRTLDQVGIQADARLVFHRMHNVTKVQLPDLQELELRVNFAQSLFSVVVGLCRELGIRHPEELSLKRPLTSLSTLAAQSNGTLGSRFGSFRRSSRKSPSQPEAVNGSGTFNPLLPRQLSATSQTGSSPRTPSSLGPPAASPTSFSSLMFQGEEQAALANSPWIPVRTAFAEKALPRQRSLAERAAANEAWLDSSRSLMEQGVRPDAERSGLLLRYKFHVYYDLNAKYDSIRINQIYEQVKWSLLSEELETLEEEALLLAALQLQITTQADLPAALSPDVRSSIRMDTVDSREHKETAAVAAADVTEDDIDAALAELEATLLSDSNCLTLSSPKRLTSVPEEQQNQSKQLQQRQQQQSVNKIPELAGFLKYLKPRKHTLRGYRRNYFILHETKLTMYTDQDRSRLQEEFNLMSAEVVPDVNTTAQKFGIRLFLSATVGPDDEYSSASRMQELWLRCDGRNQFAEWVAGISLATRGKTLASKAAFEAETSATLAQLELQTPRPQRRSEVENGHPPVDFDPENFLAPRHVKARKQSWLRQQILLRHANVRDRTLLDAKLDYIRICQRLPMFGVAYFLVDCTIGPQPDRPAVMSFSDYRREKRHGSGNVAKLELVGVAANRLMRLDFSTGQVIGAWRLEELRSWIINWELLSVQVNLDKPPHQLLLVPHLPEGSPSASKLSLCKTLVEFIGGGAFLSLRQADKSQQLDEQLFHRLTGSRDHAAS